MRASILDLRRRMREVLGALDRNEPVTILYRGRPKGVIHPSSPGSNAVASVTDHPAFGMWKDRADMQAVEQVVRSLRQGRFHAV
jgi:hypothetical protein